MTATVEQIAKNHGISEDRVYDLADAIEAAMESELAKSWTPSTMARKIKADSYETRSVMSWLVESIVIDSDPRGAWTRYFPLTSESRAQKLYHR